VITRHHFALVMMCALLVWSALFPTEPLLVAAGLTGACAGAILPDFHMKRPKRSCPLTGAWIVTRFTRFACVPAMLWVYSRILPGQPDAGDKRLTHSLPGIGVIAAMVSGIVLVPALLSGVGTALAVSTVFLAGLVLGLCLHLAEDVCTMKGISPLFPFSSSTLCGSIRPCNTTDRRIARFQAQHASVLGIFLALHATGLLPVPLLRDLSLPGLCILVGWMIYHSDVAPGKAPTGTRAPRAGSTSSRTSPAWMPS